MIARTLFKCGVIPKTVWYAPFRFIIVPKKNVDVLMSRILCMLSLIRLFILTHIKNLCSYINILKMAGPANNKCTCTVKYHFNHVHEKCTIKIAEESDNTE